MQKGKEPNTRILVTFDIDLTYIKFLELFKIVFVSSVQPYKTSLEIPTAN